MRYSDKIGREIRSVREAKGYSQEYLAEMLDMSQSSYANLESGKSTLSVDRLLSITEILEIDVHRLLQFPKRTTKTVSASNDDIASKQVGIDPKVLSVYDQLITEMRGEIAFLRELLKEGIGTYRKLNN